MRANDSAHRATGTNTGGRSDGHYALFAAAYQELHRLARAAAGWRTQHGSIRRRWYTNPICDLYGSESFELKTGEHSLPMPRRSCVP
jgi:hypothetical protein